MEVVLQMKHFNFKKLFMLLALVTVVQNSAMVVSAAEEDTECCSEEEEGIAPCSDRPDITESYN